MEQCLICQTTEAAAHSGKSLSLLFRSIAKIVRKWRNLQMISMSQEWRWKCCNLSGGVALIVWFTTNGMCVKNNIIMYVARASNCKRHCGWRELGWRTVINYNQETLRPNIISQFRLRLFVHHWKVIRKNSYLLRHFWLFLLNVTFKLTTRRAAWCRKKSEGTPSSGWRNGGEGSSGCRRHPCSQAMTY